MDVKLQRQSASAEAIEALLRAIEGFDGFPPLSEHKVLRIEGADNAIVSGWGDGIVLLAIAVAAWHGGDVPHWALEVAMSPDARSPELERAGIEAAAGTLPEGDPHSLWAHRAEQRAAAALMGYRELRRVLRMEGPFPDQMEPTDIAFGTITDVPDDEIITVHNRAFAGHPEASGMTRQRLDELRTRPWYDPDGVVTARLEGRFVGYCWTKLHPDGDGEVYLLAVDPDATGRGIGELLAGAGYAHLKRRGAERAMLWVDGDNESAIALYRRIGLEPTHTNVEMAVE